MNNEYIIYRFAFLTLAVALFGSYEYRNVGTGDVIDVILNEE